MRLSYSCKFCHLPGSVELDNGADMFQVEKWRGVLSCDRCADFREHKRTILERIKKACFLLLSFQARGKPDKVEMPMRQKFEDLTKRYAALVCAHFHRPTVWDVEFVNLLMDHPERHWRICHDYIRHVDPCNEFRYRPVEHP